MSQDAQQADIIIVGGGVGGLYCTWRLLEKNPQTKILLFEQNNRIGGRLDTNLVRIDGHLVKEEQGGMRFQKTQNTLMKLIEKLGLKKIPFNMGDKNNIFYLRGKKFTVGDTTDNKIWKTIYNLNKDEEDKSSADILEEVIDKILEKNHLTNDDFPHTPEEWQNFRLNLEYKDRKIYKWGFWSLLSEYGLSQECITMLHDTQGFVGPYIQLVNAGTALQLFEDFPKDPEFFAFPLGFGTLPKTLNDKIDEILQKNQPGWKVINEGSHVNTLNYSDGKYQVVVSKQNNSFTFSSDKVILALPKFALEKLTATSTLLSSNRPFLQAINGVVSMFLSKINLYYEERWWYTKFHLNAGGSFTDLPIDQLYCFEPIEGEEKDGPSAITLYCSDFRGNYWEELQSVGEPYHTEKFPENPPDMVPASTVVVEQATKQLKLMLGADDIPNPLLTSFKRWAVDASGSAYHQWKIGANDVDLTRAIWHPHKEVYVCGEAFSDVQAWVEGTLRTSERVLTDGFGLKPLAES